MFKSGVLFVAIMAATINSSLALSDEQQTVLKSKFLEYGLGCFELFPVTAENLITFKEKKFPENPNSKCLVACVFKKFGLMDDKGFLTKDVLTKVKKEFNDDALVGDVEKVINTCSSVNEQAVEDTGKGCDRSELLFNCLNTNAGKFGFNINL